jgi:formylmethanofuran dehydrogenase subunit B
MRLWHTDCVGRAMDEAPDDAAAVPPVMGAGVPWTCPFCSLLCDGFRIEAATPPRLHGSDCPRAQRALMHFGTQATRAAPLVNGTATDMNTALDSAAQWLRRSRQPMFGGLATDVAGARALYRLAAQVGAIADHAHGEALMHGVRAQQDRGLYYTTLAEVRTRADLIVCFGTLPGERFPEFFRRCGIGDEAFGPRHVVFLGALSADPRLPTAPSVSSECIAWQHDTFETAAVLNALVAGRSVRRAAPEIIALADRLRTARYAVIVWEAARLPAHGALLVESVAQLVNTLNRSTRAAAFSLGGNDGAYAVNQVFIWLCGLPLRTRIGADVLDHDPLRNDALRLLDDGCVDALLWVSSFGPELAPPSTTVPQVILGHPGMARPSGDVVFIPVSTPGIGSAGHLFRTDGGVVLPLTPIDDDALPSVASVVEAISQRLSDSEEPS